MQTGSWLSGTAGSTAPSRELLHSLLDAWGSWGPSISPGADHIAFVSDRGGLPQVWVQSMGRGPADLLASDAQTEALLPPARLIEITRDPVVGVQWSADGEWLAAAVASHGGVRTEVWVVRPDGSGLRKVAGDESQHAELGPFARHGCALVVTIASAEPGQPSRCMLVDPATGEQELMAEGGLVHVLDLSPKRRFALLRDGNRGAQFCVILDRREDRDHPLLPYQHIGSTSAGMIRPSPDEEHSEMTVYLVSDAGQPRSVLLAIPLGPDGTRADAGVLAAREDGELDFVDADDAGTQMLLVWNVEGGFSEFELLDTESGVRTLVPGLPGDVVNSCVLSRDGSCVVFCVESATRPREIWRLDLASITWSRVTERPPMPSVDLATPTLERYTAHDGLPLTGWLYRAGGSGMAMLSFHGGPEGQERPGWNPQHQAMVAAGITVFAPNIRGSSGFGRAFVHADDRYGRFDAFTDVRTSAQYLSANGLADAARIAVTGRSYGGYLTLVALAQYPKLFAAGVDICGMSDMLTFYRDTEPWIAAAAVSKYGDPVTDRSLLRKISPLRKAGKIRAPLLVVHGEYDTNVPIGEALQIVAALREREHDVEYLELAAEGHEYRRSASRLLLIETMARFLLERL